MHINDPLIARCFSLYAVSVWNEAGMEVDLKLSHVVPLVAEEAHAFCSRI